MINIDEPNTTNIVVPPRSPKITLEELQVHAEEMYRAAKGNAVDQAPWALVLAWCLTKGKEEIRTTEKPCATQQS